MEDEASILLDGKAVGNLRVVDLKQELEKRGLSKSGSKKDLVKRLKQQLEFERLCGERKSTGDCDLKLELDADTEQNEFVQQYLAQQQKIYAEQKEVKRLIELEEIQRSGDERGSDSPKADDASDQETHPEESSDNESQAETSEEKTQIKPEIHKVYKKKRISKESKKEISKEKTETDSAIIVDKEMTSDNESSIDGHNDRAQIKYANIEATKNLETKLKEPKVEINEGKSFSSVNVEGERKEECRVEEKEISSVVIEDRNLSKESKIDVIEKEDISSLNIDDKSNIKECKDKVIETKKIREIKNKNEEYDKSNIKECKDKVIETKKISEIKNKNEESGIKNVEESRVENVKDESVEWSKVENVKDEIIEESIVQTIEDDRIEESRVENIKDENIEGFKVENVKDESIKRSIVENIKEESVEGSIVENIKDEIIEECFIQTIEDDRMEESRVDNIKDESMEESIVENIKDESMEVSIVENIKDESMEGSITENIKDESMDGSIIENIKDESMDGSVIDNVKEESVEGSIVENIKDESMEGSIVENIKDESMDGSVVENIKDEEVEGSIVDNIKDEEVEGSRIKTFESKSIKESRVEIVGRNQESVSSYSLPLVDNDIKVKKLSDRKSIEETSNTLKSHPSSLKSSETAESLEQNQALNMEPVTEVTSVPYSLSDIQLPGSPGSTIKPISKSVLEEQKIVEGKATHSITTEAESHENGSNSSDESPVPEIQTSEAKTVSTLNGESPIKDKASSQPLNSSDSVENQVKAESSKPLEDNSPSGGHEKVVASADPKGSRRFSEGSEEGEMKSDSESATEESSDSNERRRGRRKSQKVKRKKDRRRKAGTSDSSRSRSRESSLEKAHKTGKESGLVSSKSDAQTASKRVDDSVREDVVPPHASVPTKQRLKLKRDNVVVSDSLHTTERNSSASEVSDERNASNRRNFDVVMPPATTEPNKTKPVEVQPVPKYVSTRKIRLSNRKLNEKSEDEPKGKKGKWGSFSSSQKTSQAISISTDSLKNWFPDFKLLKTPESVSEVDDTPLPIKEESHPAPQADRMDESVDLPLSTAVKEEPKVDEPETDQPDDGGVASNILFIQNLVRPFTLLQLKELLKETGNVIEEKFWIDKIKSKCFVMYETEEEAVKTRSVLNGSRWPSSNPKILSVEFATEENLQYHQSGSEPPKPTLRPPPVERAESREDRTSHSATDFRKKDRESDRRRERAKLPVREWDKNKLTQESPTRERASKSAERFKTSDKREKKEAKRRPNEDTPAKLLDDLFQKTKSSPCIYWLPLTEEQVVERKESLRLRRAEREKRIQQREQEDPEPKSKNVQSRNRTRETETRRSSTRSRSPVSRRR